MSLRQRMLKRPFFIRLLHWEYWSFGMVYTWIYPVWLLLCLRARSLFFFAAANPSIRNGGFLAETKKDIYEIMPAYLYPPTIHFAHGEPAEKVLAALREKKFSFPVVGKPEIGGRGRGVKVLKTEEDVIAYTLSALTDFHIQEFIPFPKEAGIFYYRYPGEKKGRISGIVRKEFLTVLGDGVSTIRDLLKRDNRSILQLPSLENIYGGDLDKILPKGKEKLLVPYGNHARGSKFIDDTALADPELTDLIDRVCREVKDFYFGRLDIRFNTWEELKAGKNFCVIEVNGAGSEPTHMYDPVHSIFFAWKEIIRHWYILWKISRMNHKRGHKYLTLSEGIQMFREDKKNSKLLAMMPE